MLTKTKLTAAFGLFAATCMALQAAQAAPQKMVRRSSAPALSVTSPANNAHVSSPLTIRGTAAKNNQVQVSVVAHYSAKEVVPRSVSLPSLSSIPMANPVATNKTIIPQTQLHSTGN